MNTLSRAGTFLKHQTENRLCLNVIEFELAHSISAVSVDYQLVEKVHMYSLVCSSRQNAKTKAVQSLLSLHAHSLSVMHVLIGPPGLLQSSYQLCSLGCGFTLCTQPQYGHYYLTYVINQPMGDLCCPQTSSVYLNQLMIYSKQY